MASVLNQIVENEGTRCFSVPYKKYEKVCSRAFSLKKLNQLSIVFLRYFYIRRCSFSRAIFWCHKIYGEAPFWCRKGRNTVKNWIFFLVKNTLLALVCPYNNVCGKSEKTWSDRKNNALSFCKSHYYVNARNSGILLYHIKSTKNDNFLPRSITPVMKCTSELSNGWSDQANILDLVLTLKGLSFKKIKSKIKIFSPATISGILADLLLNLNFLI